MAGSSEETASRGHRSFSSASYGSSACNPNIMQRVRCILYYVIVRFPNTALAIATGVYHAQFDSR